MKSMASVCLILGAALLLISSRAAGETQRGSAELVKVEEEKQSLSCTNGCCSVGPRRLCRKCCGANENAVSNPSFVSVVEGAQSEAEVNDDKQLMRECKLGCCRPSRVGCLRCCRPRKLSEVVL